MSIFELHDESPQLYNCKISIVQILLSRMQEHQPWICLLKYYSYCDQIQEIAIKNLL